MSLYMIKTDQDLNIIDEIDVRFAPTGTWSVESEKVHKIPEAIARRYPSQNLGLEKIIEFVPEVSTMVFHARKVGHYFDYGIMLALFEKHEKRGIFYKLFPNFISTVDVLREMVNQGVFSPIMRPGSDGKLRPSYKLDLWCDKFGIELDHHCSQSDTYAVYHIYKKTRKGLESGNLEKLWKY